MVLQIKEEDRKTVSEKRKITVIVMQFDTTSLLKLELKREFGKENTYLV